MHVIGIVVAVVAVLMGIGAIINAFEDPSDCSSNAARGYAIVFVEDDVKQQIPNPHVADFDIHTYEYYVRDGIWRIAGTGDTQNFFGGPHRFRYEGKIQCISVGDKREWKMQEIYVR